MPERLRILGPDDGPALARFFERHPHTTLFLQGNSLEAGLVDHGERHQGTWAAAFEDDEILAVATHFWNGNLIVECPQELDSLVRFAVERSGRELRAIIGQHAQVAATARALRVADRKPALDAHEDLFVLALEDLRVPEELRTGRVRCRAPRDEELSVVTQWRVDYSLEILGATDGPALRAECAGDIAALQRAGKQWVLESEGRLVAYSAFNARTPRCVQVGGVFTPPALRGRGHARCVVAGTLLTAREAGVRDAVLFTGQENQSAQAAYRALGFERVGDYALRLF
jgi:predicted GNAT family acetyltransferase